MICLVGVSTRRLLSLKKYNSSHFLTAFSGRFLPRKPQLPSIPNHLFVFELTPRCLWESPTTRISVDFACVHGAKCCVIFTSNCVESQRPKWRELGAPLPLQGAWAQLPAEPQSHTREQAHCCHATHLPPTPCLFGSYSCCVCSAPTLLSTKALGCGKTVLEACLPRAQ